MKFIRFTLVMPALAFIALLGACKKDSAAAPQHSCRITTVSSVPATPDGVYQLAYNNDGTVSSITVGSIVTTYAYNGNTVTATTLAGGVFSSRNIITLNAAGLATNVKTETKQDGSAWANNAIEYNGDEIIKSTDTQSGGGPSTVNTFTWSQQNMVGMQSGNTTSTIEYYLDKPSQPGDYLSLIQLTTGYQIYHSKNLIKSMTTGADVTTIDYTFDSEGKIISLTAKTGGTFSSLNYTYQCN